MELIAYLILAIFIKVLEWSWTAFQIAINCAFWFISLPFRLIFKIPDKAPKKASSSKKYYNDPVEKAFDHWDNSPEKLDMEDMFWLDEILGDD